MESSAANIAKNKTMKLLFLEALQGAVWRRGNHWLQSNVPSAKGAWNRKWSVLSERSQKGYPEEVIFELQFKKWMGHGWIEKGQGKG